MEIPQNTNYHLINFLRKLSDELEQNSLSSEQNKQIGEFYMNYTMNTDTSEENKFSNEELVKFITLGWYMYRCILNENSESVDGVE